MQVGDLQPIRSQIYADDGVSPGGQIVGKETASTAYVEDAESAPGETCVKVFCDPRIAQP